MGVTLGSAVQTSANISSNICLAYARIQIMGGPHVVFLAFGTSSGQVVAINPAPSYR
jgi:hypothetical protein